MRFLQAVFGVVLLYLSLVAASCDNPAGPDGEAEFQASILVEVTPFPPAADGLCKIEITPKAEGGKVPYRFFLKIDAVLNGLGVVQSTGSPGVGWTVLVDRKWRDAPYRISLEAADAKDGRDGDEVFADLKCLGPQSTSNVYGAAAFGSV